MNKVIKVELSNKNIAITGGYGYLGRAIANSLAVHGANVFVLGKDENKFLGEFSNKSISFVPCDVSDSVSIKSALKIIQTTATIDCIINNAFYLKGQSPTDMTDEDWETGIDGTLNSVFRCIREIIPIFKNQGFGKIINVSSMYGVVAPDFSVYDDFPSFLNPPHYGAAKAGVLQLTRYYASYLGKDSVTVNCVTPGPFPSEQVKEKKSFIEKLESKTCLGRIGEPEDLAGVFVFLASDAANFITGQNFIVDGGWTVR